MQENQHQTPDTTEEIPLSPLKRCPKCGESKQEKEFGTNRQTWDGLSYHCKTCRNTYATSYEVRLRARQRYHERREAKLIQKAKELGDTIYVRMEGLQRGHYKGNSPLAMLKEGRTWNELSTELDICKITLLKWQKLGAPKRKHYMARQVLRKMSAFYENLILDEKEEMAAHFYAICQRDGWEF